MRGASTDQIRQFVITRIKPPVNQYEARVVTKIKDLSPDQLVAWLEAAVSMYFEAEVMGAFAQKYHRHAVGFGGKLGYLIPVNELSSLRLRRALMCFDYEPLFVLFTAVECVIAKDPHGTKESNLVGNLPTKLDLCPSEHTKPRRPIPVPKNWQQAARDSYIRNARRR